MTLFAFSWDTPSLILPLLVFVAELFVVTLGTIRIIFVSRGMKSLAPLLGFFEIAIWLFAIGQIMQNLSNLACYLAFAGGFTLGNFLGILLEEKLALGTVLVRIITNKDVRALIEKLKAADYGVTCHDGWGATGPVMIVFTVVKRRELGKVLAIITCFDARAFYSVDELQSAAQGVFPTAKERCRGLMPNPLKLLRVGRW